jgi:hypothetical protein
MLASLRSDVANDGLSSDQQGGLIDALDSATQALNDQNPGDAASAVHDAQKALRKLGHQQALDSGTLHSFQSRLNRISAALRASADNGGNGNNG